MPAILLSDAWDVWLRRNARLVHGREGHEFYSCRHQRPIGSGFQPLGRCRGASRILPQFARALALLFAVTFILANLTLSLRAQDDDGPTSSVKVIVVRDTDGKPVKYAQVVLHPVNRKGKSQGELDLKTDADGRTSLDGVPFGKLEIQVIAKGFQTFGEEYEIKQPALEITVKLKHPTGQYSTYENHDGKNDDGKSNDGKSNDGKSNDGKSNDQAPPQKPQ